MSGLSLALRHWLDENAARFSLRTFAIEAIDELLPGFHDCSAVMEVDGERYAGRGQATSEAAALAKAIGETVERWLVARGYGLLTPGGRHVRTSNGFAVHTSARAALANARQELIERDVFLCHTLTATPFQAIPRSLVRDHGPFGRFATRLSKLGIRLRLGLLPSETGLAVVVCAAFGDGFRRPFGVVVGLGARRSREGAITKAILECWCGLLPVLHDLEDEALSRADVLALPDASIDAHHRFALHPEGGRELERLFSGPQRHVGPPRGQRFTTKPTVWARLPPPFDQCPLVGARCESSELQQLFFGLPRASDVDVARLAAFRANRNLPPAVPRMDAIHLLS